MWLAKWDFFGVFRAELRFVLRAVVAVHVVLWFAHMHVVVVAVVVVVVVVFRFEYSGFPPTSR